MHTLQRLLHRGPCWSEEHEHGHMEQMQVSSHSLWAVQLRVLLAELGKRRTMGQKWTNTKGEMLEGVKKKKQQPRPMPCSPEDYFIKMRACCIYLSRMLELDAGAVFKTSLTHSSQAGTRLTSSVPVQIGSGNVSGLDCEGSSLAKYALPTAPSRPVG